MPLMPERWVLFVCVENSCRSLMAEAMFNAGPPSGWRSTSAGTRPAARVNPRTASMLREVGLELPPHPPQLLTPALLDRARRTVTMGCLSDASCPARLTATAPTDWALADPTTLDDEGFRLVRRELTRLVADLQTELARLGPGPVEGHHPTVP
jgi:arsenate reductase